MNRIAPKPDWLGSKEVGGSGRVGVKTEKLDVRSVRVQSFGTGFIVFVTDDHHRSAFRGSGGGEATPGYVGMTRDGEPSPRRVWAGYGEFGLTAGAPQPGFTLTLQHGLTLAVVGKTVRTTVFDEIR